MQERIHLLLRIASVLIIGALILFGFNIPDTRTPLFPVKGAAVTLYSDESWGGQTSVIWIDQATNHWQCNFVQSQVAPVCGLAADLSPLNKTMDLSQQKALAVRLSYTGESHRLRVYLRNHNPDYSTLEDPDSLKFNSVNILASQFDSPETLIRLNEFAVEPWWLEERSMAREHSHPELDAILNLGIDFPYPHVMGEHNIRLDGIDLIGPKFNPERYFSIIAIAAFALMLLDFLMTLAIKRNKSGDSEQTDCLESDNTELEASSTKEGLKQKISQVFSSEVPEGNTALILFKVNEFEEIVNTEGRESANELMALLEDQVNDVLDNCDTMARWGDQEFLVLSTATEASRAQSLIKRIRKALGEFSESATVSEVKVTIGGTAITTSDDFGSAFLRAEQALYNAGIDTKQSYWQEE